MRFEILKAAILTGSFWFGLLAIFGAFCVVRAVFKAIMRMADSSGER